jgi:leader peptidase (prepilin peptidase)/N-methyltransferase
VPHPPSLLWPFLVFCAGACVGSFLNVCIYRLPEGRSVVRPGSACPHCRRFLRWWENIPLLSYVFLRARCRSCGARISPQYPLVELLSGFLALALWYRFGLGASFFIYAYFSASLLIISLIDLEHKIIPDCISLPGIVLGFLSSFFLPNLSWYDSLIGILVGGGALYVLAWGYYLIARREGMGGGDIKLLAMIGAFMGWQALPLVVFLSAAVGSILGLAVMVVRREGRHMAIPYGPFLGGAALFTLFFGQHFISWYFGILSVH